jgi:hypothetical protein
MTAKIWNTETGECSMTLTGNRSGVLSVAFHPTDPTHLATAGGDSTAKIWNTETGECGMPLTGHTHSMTSVAFHPTDPTRLATASYDKTARLWSVGGKLRRRLESEFGAAHPIVVKTLAGDAYTLEDWGLCKDLKAAVCKLAPKTLGKPATFELLGNLGNHGVGGEDGETVQIDGKYGSDDRRKMMMKGCSFNFELALVYSAAAASAGAGGE